MNIIQLLTSDHRRVDQIINQLKSGDGSDTALLLQLEREIKMHSQIEETIVYPELSKHPETADLVAEAYEEHEEVDALLAQLKAGGAVLQPVLQELADSMNHHVTEEESELFPLAAQVLGEGRLLEMGERASSMKQSGLEAA